MSSKDLVTGAATAIEVAGVGAMILGILLAGLFAAGELRRHDRGTVYRGLRQRIGRAILLGLELLIAADIIRTVSEVPSLHQVAILAGIVAIRTFLSFTLELELTGHVPWRRTDNDELGTENAR